MTSPCLSQCFAFQRDILSSRGTILRIPDGHGIFLLEEKDAEELAALEAACFTMPWSLPQYKIFLASGTGFLKGEIPPPGRDAALLKIPGALGSTPVLGLRGGGGELAAYLSLGLFPPAAEMEIYNLAVRPSSRRHGLGRTLLRLGLDLAAGIGLRRAVLEVRQKNAPARDLYAGLGFVPCGRRKGYYADSGEDALIMELCPLRED
ncbi:MAG: GNAT family N-acetyltransferase [Desulfovibrio sp.]|nr:GNAT family N-acetyltransferase [Desulfovibrio sp.]